MRRMMARLDRRLLRWVWDAISDDWAVRLAVLLWIVSLVLFVRVAFAQTNTELQRQLDRLERQIEQLRQSDVDAQRVRQGGFERLAAVETAQTIATLQLARLENFVYGSMAGLLANLIASLKALGDIRSMKEGKT